MDEIVARAMQKWPDVPDVYGWLRLDRRGGWWIRSRVVAPDGAPRFERIGNPAVVAFIGRNYAPDDRGRWFFQNGPQRVFVRLDYMPLVYRVDGGLVAHTGAAATGAPAAWLDDAGALLVATELGPGVLDDRDLGTAAEHFADPHGAPVDDYPATLAVRGDLRWRIAGHTVTVGTLRAADVPARFGFDAAPAPPAGQPDC
jgi:hypothetical protein